MVDESSTLTLPDGMYSPRKFFRSLRSKPGSPNTARMTSPDLNSLRYSTNTADCISVHLALTWVAVVAMPLAAPVFLTHLSLW